MENTISIFKILFWHLNRVVKSYFDIQNPILTFELSGKILFLYSKSELIFALSRNMLFWHSKTYFDIRTESEKAILAFKILFWHSNWVAKCYFCIPNPIFTFEQSRKIVFWYSKSYIDDQTKSEYRIQNSILTFELSRKIVFWHSKSYFDIRTESENAVLIFKIIFWHPIEVGKSNIQNIVFWLFWHSN